MEKKNNQKKVSGKYWQGTGRRKTAISSARIYKTSAKENKLVINSQKAEAFFPTKELSDIVFSPLKILGKIKMKVEIIVKGGGVRGQAEATRHAISKALIKFDESLRKQLKELGYLTRDSRKVERKKPGLKKARKAPQFSKR
ncbi:MAG: 30S ribosomal protein S9 [Patescibacteria group bacterium]|nr:30S ribosomal protein S9 [Patescibacteria group bacterium]